MLTEFLGNDIMKDNLLKVVTNIGPPRNSPKQGELCFQITSISQRYVSAWEIIDKVYQQVGCKNLTVGVIQPELETILMGPGWKKEKKSNGRRRNWIPFMFQ